MKADLRHQFFEISYKCQFQETAAQKLVGRYKRIENTLNWSLMGSVFAALCAGSATFLSNPTFTPLWAMTNLLAMGISIFGAVRSPHEKIAGHFSTSRDFRSLVLNIENYVLYRDHSKTSELSLKRQLNRFHRDYAVLVDSLDHEHQNFADHNNSTIFKELNARLESQGLIQNG